jgi:hypothetical protein
MFSTVEYSQLGLDRAEIVLLVKAGSTKSVRAGKTDSEDKEVSNKLVSELQESGENKCKSSELVILKNGKIDDSISINL